VFWTTDVTLRVTSFLGGGIPNAGYRPTELVGRHVAELFRQDDGHNTPLDAHRRALNGETVAYDMRWRERAYGTHVEPLRGEKGRIVGCAGVARENAPTSAEGGGRMGKRAGASPGRTETPSVAPLSRPDVNALMAMIQGYAHMLLLRLVPTDPMRESILEIVHASDRAARQLDAKRRRC
jgi:hypothetical protein